jgi:hypothetical protein
LRKILTLFETGTIKQLRFLFFTIASWLVLPVRAALPAPDSDGGAITLPPGFRALVVADNLVSGYRAGALRFPCVAPNGDIYGKAYQNGLFALRDTDGDGRARCRRAFRRRQRHLRGGAR